MLAEKPFWGVTPFGYRIGINEDEQEIIDRCKKMLLEYCDKSMEAVENSCYNSAYGNSPEDFICGPKSASTGTLPSSPPSHGSHTSEMS